MGGGRLPPGCFPCFVGEVAMRMYRMFCLDGAGRIERAEEFEAVNDDQAIKTARLMNKSVWFEVWERGRRVAQVEYPESRETPPERPRCQQP